MQPSLVFDITRCFICFTALDWHCHRFTWEFLSAVVVSRRV